MVGEEQGELSVVELAELGAHAGDALHRSELPLGLITAAPCQCDVAERGDPRRLGEHGDGLLVAGDGVRPLALGRSQPSRCRVGEVEPRCLAVCGLELVGRDVVLAQLDGVGRGLDVGAGLGLGGDVVTGVGLPGGTAGAVEGGVGAALDEVEAGLPAPDCGARRVGGEVGVDCRRLVVASEFELGVADDCQRGQRRGVRLDDLAGELCCRAELVGREAERSQARGGGQVVGLDRQGFVDGAPGAVVGGQVADVAGVVEVGVRRGWCGR